MATEKPMKTFRRAALACLMACTAAPVFAQATGQQVFVSSTVNGGNPCTWRSSTGTVNWCSDATPLPTTGSGSSSGSGGGAVTAAPNSYATGYSVDLGKAADVAYTDTTGQASGGLVALNKGQYSLLNTINGTLGGLLKAGQSVNVGNFPATQAVTLSGNPSVSVSNFPATQPVSGTVTANIGTTNGLALDASVQAGVTAQNNATTAINNAAATASKAGTSYTLATNGTAAAAATPIAGAYALNLPTAFNGATETITTTSSNGTATTATYTVAPATPPIINVFAGTTVSASFSGGTPTGTTTLAGIGGPMPAPLARQAVDTIVPSALTNRSAVVGFTSTASAATSASTSLTVTTTSNFTSQAGTLTGIPFVGQIVSGTGITAGTTITAVTANSATSYALTLSTAATVASGAAVTSAGPQVIMAANATRRGFSVQDQNATYTNVCYLNTAGVATAGPDSLIVPGQYGYFDTKDSQAPTGAVSALCTVAAQPTFDREW